MANVRKKAAPKERIDLSERLRAKLLHPDEKTTAPKALGAAKARDKRKGEL